MNYLPYPVFFNLLWLLIESPIGYFLLLLGNQIKKHCLIAIKPSYHILYKEAKISENQNHINI